MTRRVATFAIPGDIDTLTGGYIYEKQLLLALRRIGWDIAHLALPGGFPDPEPGVTNRIGAELAALPPNQPVILDGFLPGAMPPDQLARLRAPFVAVTHHPLGYETGLPPDRAARLCATERANLARAAHVIVPSPHTAAVLVSDFAVPRDRITVAPPGIARPDAVPAPRTGAPLILSVGQLVPRKGHDVLLRALAPLIDLDWSVSIVGAAADPGHARDLADLSRSLGLSDRVSFAGLLSPAALSREFARAQVFALATRYEGYGMVFAEALVHGLPIVTCAAGAVPDTVPGAAGLLVPPDDVPALSAALRRVLSDPALRARLADASARHGAALPGWEDTARIVGDVLARVGP
jgi:glycosyltransferase involved in cell wall biosynthesis